MNRLDLRLKWRERSAGRTTVPELAAAADLDGQADAGDGRPGSHQGDSQPSGGREVKIVAVTASAFTEQRDEMLAAGMDDFVRKPYRASELYECLGRQLGCAIYLCR